MQEHDRSDPSDMDTTVATLKLWTDQFAFERNWENFHTPKNLSMSVAIEAAELMEHFQWAESIPQRNLSELELAAVAEEVVDVLSYLLRLASVLELDLTKTLRLKMAKNALKYPI
jgi:dCTP diphosphatase